MKVKQLHSFFFIGLLIISLYLFGTLLVPYLTVIALTVALAVLSYPLYERLYASLKIKGLASFATLLIVLFVIAVPLGFFGRLLFEEAYSFFSSLRDGGYGALTESIQSFESVVQSVSPSFSIDLSELGEQMTTWLSGNIQGIFSSAAHAFASVVIGMVLFYYLLKDGPYFRQEIIEKSPIGANHTEKVINKFKVTINSIVKGNLLIALVQGIFTGIGFAFFGVPNPVLWATIAGIMALIPVLGTTLVLAGGIIYVYLTSPILMALGLLVWSMVVVGFVDDIMRPYVIGRGANIHPMLVLLSVLGGAVVYGAVGLIIGPLILTLFVVMFELLPDILEKNTRRSAK